MKLSEGEGESTYGGSNRASSIPKPWMIRVVRQIEKGSCGRGCRGRGSAPPPPWRTSSLRDQRETRLAGERV